MMFESFMADTFALRDTRTFTIVKVRIFGKISEKIRTLSSPFSSMATHRRLFFVHAWLPHPSRP